MKYLGFIICLLSAKVAFADLVCSTQPCDPSKGGLDCPGSSVCPYDKKVCCAYTFGSEKGKQSGHR